jgi:hypothetical protein
MAPTQLLSKKSPDDLLFLLIELLCTKEMVCAHSSESTRAKKKKTLEKLTGSLFGGLNAFFPFYFFFNSLLYFLEEPKVKQYFQKYKVRCRKESFQQIIHECWLSALKNAVANPHLQSPTYKLSSARSTLTDYLQNKPHPGRMPVSNKSILIREIRHSRQHQEPQKTRLNVQSKCVATNKESVQGGDVKNRTAKERQSEIEDKREGTIFDDGHPNNVNPGG